jgi:hypothetical protein
MLGATQDLDVRARRPAATGRRYQRDTSGGGRVGEAASAAVDLAEADEEYVLARRRSRLEVAVESV